MSLASAFELALDVIRGYELEIRNTRGTITQWPRMGEDEPEAPERTLAEQGFCQGRMYVDAVERLRREKEEG
jgi:hypothetical protein